MNSWVRMSGAGNTFLVGHADQARTESLTPETARTVVPSLLASNSTPAPLEGLIVVDPSSYSFNSEFYNPDGSHGMLCGNGARCAVRFAIDHGTVPTDGRLPFTLNGLPYLAMVDSDGSQRITVVLPAPTNEQQFAAGSLRDVPCEAYYVFVPSDHVVIDMPKVDALNTVRSLRHHPLFPRGVNVNMVEIGPDGIVNIATYERGVEGVTGACGTGAVASAVALWRQGRCSDKVTLRPPSGRCLDVTIHHEGSTIVSVDLTGDAQYDS
ncbi:MAG: diaminopimelate epimerase [Bradyrhizobiaceae bacterium]|nr:diaminopimelate epimerase [Bradyrhizobiaceae bacterium]